jgi:hypothetical protein
VGVVSEREDNREGPSGMRALSEDPAFTALRGSNRRAFTGTRLRRRFEDQPINVELTRRVLKRGHAFAAGGAGARARLEGVLLAPLCPIPE